MDIVSARQKGRTLAAQAGFSEGDQTVIAAAISEIARNILMYAKRGEIALSLVVMVLACWGAAYLASRVFRIGILMYGKPATPRELWRWLRAA